VSSADAFDGIPAEAFDFYDGLEADNSKTYWTAQRTVYDECVRGPLTAMLAGLEPEFGPGVVFRPYRDVRFSKSKLPYKDHQGAFVQTADAVGYYLQIGAEGLRVAGGWYEPAPPQVARYRDVVAGPAGAELERVVSTVTSAGFELGGDRLKTRPRGVDPDHPRLDLLRHRSVVASRSWAPEPWMSEPSALLVVRDAWRTLAPLVEWLAASVGPGDPERRRR
jgi:uncharacterized protein (TIGR02453 family)